MQRPLKYKCNHTYSTNNRQRGKVCSTKKMCKCQLKVILFNQMFRLQYMYVDLLGAGCSLSSSDIGTSLTPVGSGSWYFVKSITGILSC